jgi:hypothetical protein
MDIKEFAQFVKNMRDAQKAYFRDRKPSDLQNSKMYEKAVDQSIDTILKEGPDNQTSLEL